jgi:hypothetical protein
MATHAEQIAALEAQIARHTEEVARIAVIGDRLQQAACGHLIADHILKLGRDMECADMAKRQARPRPKVNRPGYLEIVGRGPQ